jgi:hypothetical protein
MALNADSYFSTDNTSPGGSGRQKSKWPDLYALLGIAPDADAETMRKRIREAYVEATANSDHRNMERRIHFQTMVERIIPQCRRILLDDNLRAEYDYQSGLHRAGNPAAIDYTEFLRSVPGSGVVASPSARTALPGKQGESTSVSGSMADEESAADWREVPAVVSHTTASDSVVSDKASTPLQNTTPADIPHLEEEEDNSASLGALASIPAVTFAPESMPAMTDEAATTEGAATDEIGQNTTTPQTLRNTVGPSDVKPSASGPTTPSNPSPPPRRSIARTRSHGTAAPAPTAPAPPAVESTPPDATSTYVMPSQVAPAPTAATDINAASSGTTAPEAVTSAPVAAESLVTTPAITRTETVASTTAHAAPAAPNTPSPTSAEAVQRHSTADFSDDDGAVRAVVLPSDVAAAISDPDANTSTPDMLRGGRVRQRASSSLRRNLGTTNNNRKFLSHTSQMLATGIVGALLMLFIIRPNATTARVPVRIVYASGLHDFMENSKQRFEKSDAGTAIELQMLPVDSRAGMIAALAPGYEADLWIPAESLWSDRFNQVAPTKGIKPISLARSFALSPYVLIARSDHAASLRRQFPNRLIPSWTALRAAVTSNAPGHFGLSDPLKSGSGAIARYFMAREWSTRNGVPWRSDIAKNENLWNWMKGFEENVPVSAKLSADMVRDLALGTGSRYWWAIALESDAVGWMKAKKPIEVFYLPQTNYADHPLCFMDHAGTDTQISSARAVFDAYIRSDATQGVLLQSGYRPTDIELKAKVEGNPFNDAAMRQKGLKTEGFTVVERINYRILNALNSAWSARWGNA